MYQIDIRTQDRFSPSSVFHVLSFYNLFFSFYFFEKKFRKSEGKNQRKSEKRKKTKSEKQKGKKIKAF